MAGDAKPAIKAELTSTRGNVGPICFVVRVQTDTNKHPLHEDVMVLFGSTAHASTRAAENSALQVDAKNYAFRSNQTQILWNAAQGI